MFHKNFSVILLILLAFISVDLRANLLIENVRIIDKKGRVSKPSSVYIQNGLITKIAKTIKPSEGDQTIKGRGQYLIPGLIDSHVHLHGIPGESDDLSQAIREQAIQQIPRSYLYFGFTTVLDVMSGDEVIDRWNEQDLAPRAYYCVGVPIPGGYPLYWLPKNKQLSSPMGSTYLYDPRQKDLMASTPGSDLHRVKPLVKAIANTQARCIKTYYEKGFGQHKNHPVPTKAMMQGLVQEARKYNLPVFVHGNSMEAHKFAIEAGAAMMVHGVWHGVKNSNYSEIEQLAALTKAKGVAVQPTIQVIYGETQIFNLNFFENTAVKKAIPAKLIEWYQSNAGQWFAKRMAMNYGVANVEKEKRLEVATQKLNGPLEVVRAHIRALMAKNSILHFGSDTPSGPLYTQFPGYNGRQEITRWAEMGVPLDDIFKALTYENAKLLKLENTIGSVEKGKRADLLLLKQNPLETVKAYDSIEWVILEGKAVERERLAAE